MMALMGLVDRMERGLIALKLIPGRAEVPFDVHAMPFHVAPIKGIQAELFRQEGVIFRQSPSEVIGSADRAPLVVDHYYEVAIRSDGSTYERGTLHRYFTTLLPFASVKNRPNAITLLPPGSQMRNIAVMEHNNDLCIQATYRGPDAECVTRIPVLASKNKPAPRGVF